MVLAPAFLLYYQWPYNKGRGRHRGTDKGGHHHFPSDRDGGDHPPGNIFHGGQYDEHGHDKGKSHYGNKNDQYLFKKTVFAHEQEQVHYGHKDNGNDQY